ncbi:chemotaxis protein CheW [Undibacterium sp.]|jgi:purine-binding chemotaxis protein CheW|uniref:chemotaxis protein CheW n=1 Tax=Undibacterium sp. TaxID=1914977 RepID=UPI002C9A0588|nr:chemotaxis protein CheW [Undibacterium sp.]HTD02581.1 chemotaxis protein CheW [Undibacterium sp.]
MDREGSTTASFLICRDDGRLCAFALADVAETMRPLPVQALQGMPPFLLGVSLIRGAMLPVVNLAMLIGDAGMRNDSKHSRYVSLKLGPRRVAIAVQEVLGVRKLDGETLAGMPALLYEVGADAISAISVLDTELLLVLKGAHLISESVWLALEKDVVHA